MCDTFVILPPWTPDGSVVFGKNSDREPNEALALEYLPAAAWESGSRVSCTYIQVPQARETNAVLLCRPFWMWGAEMGANDRGVVIGNEAVFTRMPLDRAGGLTGMDLLRLALERSSSAEAALERMVGLLADHGQGGICGYEDRRMAYHNSFLIADPAQAWVLETAGPLWAALRVRDAYAISNGLTIGEEMDLAHPDLVATARKRGFLKKGRPFHFARCFSDRFYTTFSACRRREGRSRSLIETTKAGPGWMDVSRAFAVLRDHEGQGYRPDSHFLGNRLCAHAANPLTRNATQTTGSLVASLREDRRTYWATGTAAPCTGIFKPLWFEGECLPDVGPAPGARYDDRALWWRHERLHRSALLDLPDRLDAYRGERDALEVSFLHDARSAKVGERWQVSEAAFRKAREMTDAWTERIAARKVRARGRWSYRRYWHGQNRRAGMPRVR